jgi:predicted DNA-binding transcriptional regulator AlpA
MQEVTITQITPTELESLIENSLRKILSTQQKDNAQQTDHWFDLIELCNYLPDKPAKPTVYGWVSSSLIPHHKRAKKLFFLKSEIDTWLKESRRKTLSEIQASTQPFIGKKRNG